MFALKAARDAMNQKSSGQRLYLVVTGSHRNKLSELILTARAPSYGGVVKDFLVLGEDFVQTLISQLDAAQGAAISVEDGIEAFEILMYQPKAFMQVLHDEIFEAALWKRKIDLAACARTQRDALSCSLEAEHDGLTKVQRALFEALVVSDETFSPFSSSALDDFAQRMGAKSVSKSTVQHAMRALVDEEFVGQPGAGLYAVDNQDMLDMHRRIS